MSATKRYAVFTYDRYYPRGGWSDFRGAHETLEEAVAAMNACRDDYGEVVDLETLRVVERGG